MPLLGLYLDSKLLNHLEPYLNRLGELACGRLGKLAMTADKETPKLEVRTRTGTPSNEAICHPAYREMEQIAFSEFGMAAASHVPSVLCWHEAFKTKKARMLSELLATTICVASMKLSGTSCQTKRDQNDFCCNGA